MDKMLKITWARSTIGHCKTQRATIRSLGLKKLNQTVIKKDTPQIRGMISRVQHLVTVEEV
ncbi:MAG: 50S ribosomal protein L30 [Syntrophomonadaceae bacterium]|nr:50S ribosomal protein L30 [Syntrophomonadaceae bacterium]